MAKKRVQWYSVLIDNLWVSSHERLATALRKARREAREEDFRTVRIKAFTGLNDDGKVVRVCEVEGRKIVCRKVKSKGKKRRK